MSGYIKAILLALIVVTVLQFNYGIFGYGRLNYLALKSSENAKLDPCADKQRCLLIFVTPWCPACHASIPFLKSLQQWSSDNTEVGFQLVIGSDTEDNLISMAKEIGEPYYLDLDGKFSSEMPGLAVPRWAVIDNQRTILNRGSGLPNIDNKNPAFEEYVKSFLS